MLALSVQPRPEPWHHVTLRPIQNDTARIAALATMDDSKRAALIAEAMEIGMRDVGMLTLYVMSNSWVARKGIAIFPRADELTIAISTRPQPSP